MGHSTVNWSCSGAFISVCPQRHVGVGRWEALFLYTVEIKGPICLMIPLKDAKASLSRTEVER